MSLIEKQLFDTNAINKKKKKYPTRNQMSNYQTEIEKQ